MREGASRIHAVSSLTNSVRTREPLFIPRVSNIWNWRHTSSSIFFSSSTRHASSSSSKRWQTRQGSDKFAKEARVQGLMSRAAFKLLEMNEKYKIFKKGQTVVDLGFAPGSWSQVAADRTSPEGRVIGIDIIPAQPPKGVSTIQGNFLSESVRNEVKRFLKDRIGGKVTSEKTADSDVAIAAAKYPVLPTGTGSSGIFTAMEDADEQTMNSKQHVTEDRLVDVVLSDMSEPWAQTTGFRKRSLSNPYYRMMNTSGMHFRDHAGSMDLCNAALTFSFDSLRPGGSFVCKYYQGAEDKDFERRLKCLFAKVHREKPESSRSESREAYFVALKRKADVRKEVIFG